uniref:Uncharacterized protein n=1 Tax=Anguilla anguilla TaxID=7936 RepID=A0A0E9RA22_ANGAN
MTLVSVFSHLLTVPIRKSYASMLYMPEVSLIMSFYMFVFLKCINRMF